MSFDRRVDRLEELFRGSEDAYSPDRDLVAIFDELSALKASRASRYRGGRLVEGEDLPRQLLGEGYTPRELLELAVARGLEKRGYSAGEVADRIPLWLAKFGR